MKQIVKSFFLMILVSLCALPLWAQDVSEGVTQEVSQTYNNSFSVPLWFVAALIYVIFLLISHIFHAKDMEDGTQGFAILSIASGLWAGFLAAASWYAVVGRVSHGLSIAAFICAMFATFRANGIFQDSDESDNHSAGYIAIIIYSVCMYFV